MRHRRPSAFAALWPVVAFLAAGLGTSRGYGQTSAPTDVVPVGTRKQLLVDDRVIQRTSRVTRELGVVTKANGGRPVLAADRPWEDDSFGFYGTVLHDRGKFRMWYRPWPTAIAYAESADGLRWEKPDLGLYDFQIERAKRGAFEPRPGGPPDYRGTKNNILGDFGMGFSCFLDPHETDPGHRYKAAYGHPTKIRACLAHSADGLRWAPYHGGEPVTGRAADTYNQLLWDPGAKLYRLYTRTDFGAKGGPDEVRGSRHMTNPDVKTDPAGWTTVRAWRFDREPREEKRRQVYSLTNWIYEGVHFGLVFVYEWPNDLSEGPYDLRRRHERDVLNFYLATSRDGDTWDLSWVYAGKPLVPRGPADSFDKGFVLPASGVVTHQDRHWIYYAGARERHERSPRHNAIGLATLRLDGFVGLRAGDADGTVETRPFRLEGSRLAVNAEARAGTLRVEVLDAAGRPVPGFTARECQGLAGGDELRYAPRWRDHADLTALKGQVVRLRFHLKNATLYAFQVRP